MWCYIMWCWAMPVVLNLWVAKQNWVTKFFPIVSSQSKKVLLNVPYSVWSESGGWVTKYVIKWVVRIL